MKGIVANRKDLGMYIKNISGNYQTFEAAGGKFKVAPGEVVALSKEQSDDAVVQFVLSRGIFADVGKKDAVKQMEQAAEEKAAKEAESKIEVKRTSDDTVKRTVMAQCSGVKKNGEKCGNNVPVDADEYDEKAKYYCRLHVKQAE